MRVSDGNRVPRLKNHMVDTTNVEEHQTASTVNKEEETSEFSQQTFSGMKSFTGIVRL